MSNFIHSSNIFRHYKLFPFQIGGLTVQNQHFVVMEEEDINLRSSVFEGIVGLGFSGYLVGRQNTSDYPCVPMRTFYRPTPIFKNIVNQELVSLNVFSFYYARQVTAVSQTFSDSNFMSLNTFAAIVDLSRFNNSCLKSPASTLVDLTFQSRALRPFSLNQLRNLSL